MIKRSLSLLLGGLLMISPVYSGPIESIKSFFSGAEHSAEPTIKILLEKETEGAMVQVTGPYNIYDPYTGRRLATRFTGKSAFIQPVREGVRWGEVFSWNVSSCFGS